MIARPLITRIRIAWRVTDMYIYTVHVIEKGYSVDLFD